MNLRSSNKEKQNNHGHSPMRHMLHMVLCCGLPIVIILSLPFIAGISPGIAGILGVVAPFICPVMMGGMMLMMFSKKKSSCCEETKTETNRSEISAK
ncbi:MAG: hypothetical protein ACYDEX_03730 [Mobilitalea sp.]